MALPYGEVMRGFTPQWCYDHIRDILSDNLKNIHGAKSLDGRESYFIGYEKLDARVAEQLSLPTARISLSQGAKIANSLIGGIPQIVYNAGDIVHSGTGTDQVSLSGSHDGNNKFTLEITTSGTVGTDGSYELRKTPWTGSAWGTEVVVSSGSIPASGEIPAGNGQTFKFEIGESVVDDDSYGWETGAYKVSNVWGRTVVQRARVEIYFFMPDEITWETNNPLDQLALMFNNRWHDIEVVTGYTVRIEEELTSIRPFWTNVEFGNEKTRRAFVVAADLRYQGPDKGREPVAFLAQVSPLVTTLIPDDDHDIHEETIPED